MTQHGLRTEKPKEKKRRGEAVRIAERRVSIKIRRTVGLRTGLIAIQEGAIDAILATANIIMRPIAQ